VNVIFEGLLALDLPATLGPPLSTPTLEGLERWLFTGRWHRRASTCTLSSAVVLARVLAVLHEQGSWNLTLRDDAQVLLDLPLASPSWGESPSSWPERLPPEWTRQPCDFQLSGTRTGGYSAQALTLRYQPRHEAESGALVAALRLAWSVPADEDSEQAERDRDITLRHEGRLLELSGRIEAQGLAALTSLGDGLTARFPDSAASLHHSVRVMHGLAQQPNAFSDLLEGLGSDALLLAKAVEIRARKSRRSWPARNARGVPGRLQAGRFHANTLQETPDAL
jgi:hypothetical protein